jgi:hypothetical protein
MPDTVKMSQSASLEARDTANKSDCCHNPTEARTLSSFCYVSKGEDIICRERDIAVLLRAVSVALISLASTIAICLVLTIRSIPILMLLALPSLQQLATSAVLKRIRRTYPSDLWIRGYSPFTPSATSLSFVAEDHHQPDQ